jgi:hypothetical protein
MISPVLLPLIILISVPPLTFPNFVSGFETDARDGQKRLRAVERLDLALLVDTQYDRSLGRIEVKPDDITHPFRQTADRSRA